MNFGYVTENGVNSNVRYPVTVLFYGISICKKDRTEVKGGLQMGVSMKFTDLDQYLFGQGTNYEVYKKLGAIRLHTDEKRVYILRSGHRMHSLFL